MRPLPRLLLATLALNLNLAAAEVPTTGAKIARVTVYADRAEVVRRFATTLPAGEHALVFDALPGETDLSSVRVNGQGSFSLIDIRAETIQTLEVTDTQVRELSAKLKAEQVKLQEVTQAQTRNAQRRASLDKVLGRLTAVGKESANPDLDPAKWAGYLSYHVDSLAKLDQETLDLKGRDDALRAEINRLERELNQLNGNRTKSRNVARVKIEVTQAGPQEFELSYVVAGPSWSPRYDVRADTVAKKLTVAYQALVRQRTGEDWQGVTLRLSTAQPGVAGREPELTPWALYKAEPVVPTGAVLMDGGGLAAAKLRSAATARRGLAKQEELKAAADFAPPPAPAAVAMEISAATVQAGATAALFQVPRAYDIPSDPKSVKVALTEQTFFASFRHSCVPKLSPNVYLKAQAVNASDYPFLPGPTAVFLDGAYVAAASMDLVPAGQEFVTFLGVDQAVKVERRVLARREEVTGVFGKKTHRTVHDQLFKVTNGKRADIDLTVGDQLPMSNHDAIKVVLEEPRYEKDTDALKLNEQKFLEWRLRLGAGDKLDLPFRFAVERPEDVIVVGQ
ncbi:MAG: mucoidy inhibitor MuiA family protein [Opitutia bacterium]